MVTTAFERSLDNRLAVSRQSLSIVRAVADQLAEFHEQGRLHLDIGPETVHRDAVTDRVVLDTPRSEPFVIGSLADEERCPPELRVGTSIKIPSDLATARRLLISESRPGDPMRIDVYQLGALLCRLLSEGGTVGEFARSPRFQARLPQSLRPLLERTLTCGGAERISTIAEFLKQLGDCEKNLTDTGSAHAGDSAAPTPTGTAESRTDHGMSSSALPPPSLSDQQLGHYRLAERLGRGGMGDVYRAYEAALNRWVAVKVLPTELACFPDFVQRFRTEAAATASLAHPAIVPIYFIGEDRGVHFFAMQYVPGESLAQILARRDRLPWREAVAFVRDILSGLSVAHRAGLVHRDIKPGNLLWDEVRQQALVADFGLAKTVQTTAGLTNNGTLLGTADYISPEQGRGLPVDQRADLYSLGCVLYRMLAGRLPFCGDSATSLVFQHAYETVPPLAELTPDVPPGLANIVLRLLSKQPQDRYPDADAVSAALQNIEEAPSSRDEPQKSRLDGSADALPSHDLDCRSDTLNATKPAITNHEVDRPTDTILQIEQVIRGYEQRLAELQTLARDALPLVTRRQSEQDDSVGDIQLQLAKVGATLQTLRSQRDVLMARLSTADAIASFGVRPRRRSIAKRWPVAVGGALLVAFVGLILIKALWSTPPISIATIVPPPKGESESTTVETSEPMTSSSSSAIPVIGSSIPITPGLEILEARYGVRDKWVDLTPRFQQAAAKSQRLVAVVHSALVGGDFAFGASKHLKLRYRLNGRYYEESPGDHSVVLLDASPKVHAPSDQFPDVLNAWFGAGLLGEEGFVDVTDVVRSHLVIRSRSMMVRPSLASLLRSDKATGPRFIVLRYRFGSDEIRLQAFPDDAPISFDEPSAPNLSAAPLQILDARFGAGENWVDLTTRLRQSATTGRFGLVVQTALVGNDPAFGKTKILSLTYREAGRWQSRLYGEGSLVFLDSRTQTSSAGAGLQIHEAFTFTDVLDEKPPTDITTRMREQIRENRITIPVQQLVSASNFGFKLMGCVVLYSLKGEQRMALCDQHERLELGR